MLQKTQIKHERPRLLFHGWYSQVVTCPSTHLLLCFCGRWVTNTYGGPELLCNNRGKDFVEAHGDMELSQLHLRNLDASVEGKLVPKKKDEVFAV